MTCVPVWRYMAHTVLDSHPHGFVETKVFPPCHRPSGSQVLADVSKGPVCGKPTGTGTGRERVEGITALHLSVCTAVSSVTQLLSVFPQHSYVFSC